jgi:hypothetical protein
MSARRGQCADRETSIAFGDVEFGAGLNLSSALAANVKASSQKLATVYSAPGVKAAALAKPKAPAAKLTGSVSLSAKPSGSVKAAPKAVPPAPARPLVPSGMTAPTAAGKASANLLGVTNTAAVKAAAKAETAAHGKGSAPSSAPAYPDVSHANFLDPASGPIQSKPVLAPKLTPAQEAANANALKSARAEQIRADARKTAQLNVPYMQQKAADAKWQADYEARMRVEDSPEAEAWRARQKVIHGAHTDWGLIPAGAAVLAAGAAIIATGGAAAGAIAAPSAATVAGAAVAADRALAATEKAKLVDTKGLAGKASGVIDAGLKAKAILDNTVKLAEAGVPGAIEGVKAIAETAAKRALSGALPGVPMDLTVQGAKDYAKFASQAPALATALASAGPVASTGFVDVRALGAKPVAVASSASLAAKKAKLAGSVDAPARPRWLVTLAGKVLDVDVTPNAVNAAGWLVWTNGKVAKQ